MNVPQINGEPIARLLRNPWLVPTVLAAVYSVGFGMAMWLVRVPKSQEVADLKEQVAQSPSRIEFENLQLRVVQTEMVNRVLRDSVAILTKKAGWIICNSVPPNKPEVRSALQERCEYDSPGQRTIYGVPLLNFDEE